MIFLAGAVLNFFKLLLAFNERVNVLLAEVDTALPGIIGKRCVRAPRVLGLVETSDVLPKRWHPPLKHVGLEAMQEGLWLLSEVRSVCNKQPTSPSTPHTGAQWGKAKAENSKC